MKTTKEKLSLLRGLMKEKGLDAYLISSSDPHQSEYVAPYWSTRTWLSGFTGSAGTLIVTQDEAGLWTDSRYFIQAEKQLDGSTIKLQKQGVQHAPEHIDWLIEQLPSGSKVGFDGQVISLAGIRSLERKLSTKGIRLQGKYDLAGKIWEDRPGLPESHVFELPTQFSGKTREEKITELREWLKVQEADGLFLPALDDIAWLLNIRASDVESNPVCLSYLLLTENEITWCVNQSRIDPALLSKLKEEGVVLRSYDEALNVLQSVSASDKLIIDPSTISFAYFEALSGKYLSERPSPVQAMKAVKNEKEVANLKQTMRKDAVALLKLFRWLDDQLDQRTVSEVEVGEQLVKFRSAQANYHGESFNAIVGYKGNGAIVHYRAEPESCAQIKKEGMLLLDSGGQYWDGTTDITRTIALSSPSQEEKTHFTLVLKGMMALSQVRFPKGTSGVQLDTLARQFLWQEGLNYGHGTGHGVGFFLNVHEGPQGIMPNAASKGKTAFEVGMLTSNEPGFYRQGHYGIRIENLVLCVEDQTTDYGDFLKFETMTLFPIDQNLIDTTMLSTAEINWLNAYHQKVYEAVSPLLDREEKDWLEKKCATL